MKTHLSFTTLSNAILNLLCFIVFSLQQRLRVLVRTWHSQFRLILLLLLKVNACFMFELLCSSFHLASVSSEHSLTTWSHTQHNGLALPKWASPSPDNPNIPQCIDLYLLQYLTLTLSLPIDGTARTSKFYSKWRRNFSTSVLWLNPLISCLNSPRREREMT